jgi:Na+-driven multidrug efflux pump
VQYTLRYFRIVPIGYAFFAAAFIEANVFQWISRSWPGFWITLARVCIAVVITAITTVALDLPIWWIWIAIVIGSIIASIGWLVWTWRALIASRPQDAEDDFIDAEEILLPPVG